MARDSSSLARSCVSETNQIVREKGAHNGGFGVSRNYGRFLAAASLGAVLTLIASAQTTEFRQRFDAGYALRMQGRYAEAQKALSALLHDAGRNGGESVFTAIVSDSLGGVSMPSATTPRPSGCSRMRCA